MIIDGKDLKFVKESLEISIEEMEEYYYGVVYYWEMVGEIVFIMGLVGVVMGFMLVL